MRVTYNATKLNEWMRKYVQTFEWYCTCRNETKCKVLAWGQDSAEQVCRLRGPSPSVCPSIFPPPPSQWVNEHRSHSITVLCNSNPNSFPAAVYVALKTVFMKVFVFLMPVPFDNSLSAELVGRITVSHGRFTEIISGAIFSFGSLTCFCLFVSDLYAIMVNNWLHNIWEKSTWLIYLVFLHVQILTTGGKCRC